MSFVLHKKLLKPLKSMYHVFHIKSKLKIVHRSFGILGHKLMSQTEVLTKGTASLPHYLKPFASESPEDLLSKVKFMKLTCYDAAMFLKALRVHTMLKNTNFETLCIDPAFRILCAEFECNCHILAPSLLISGLRSLLEIGMNPTSSCIQQVETVILSHMITFTMTDLVGCLHLHTKYPQGQLQGQVVAELVSCIQKRFVEISTSAELLMLAQMFHLFDRLALKQMELKFQKEIMKSMTPAEVSKLICILAENNTRNKPLLRSAAFHLTSKSLKPRLKETVDILYALKTLNVNDFDLLLYLTEDIADEIPSNLHPSLISGLLSACGQLAWRHSDVLNACGQWIIDNSSSCTSKEYVSYLLAIAALNFVPQDITIVTRIFNHLNKLDVSKDVWLDVVWSLAVINCIDKDVLLNVLSKDFYQSLIDGTGFKSLSNKLKLMNLKSCLKNDYPECVFSCELYLEPQEIPKSDKSQKNKNFVVESLGDYIPKEKYMAFTVNTDMGVCIDAEFILNEKGKPLSLLEYGLKSKPMIAAKPLPFGSKRVALLVWLYKDFTLNEKVLTGFHALAVRLLKNEGYAVVQVPYSNFPKKGTDVQRVLHLVDLINKTVLKKS